MHHLPHLPLSFLGVVGSLLLSPFLLHTSTLPLSTVSHYCSERASILLCEDDQGWKVFFCPSRRLLGLIVLKVGGLWNQIRSGMLHPVNMPQSRGHALQPCF